MQLFPYKERNIYIYMFSNEYLEQIICEKLNKPLIINEYMK